MKDDLASRRTAKKIAIRRVNDIQSHTNEHVALTGIAIQHQ